MQVHPGRGLGFLTLGASLHDVLTRLKSQPLLYPTIDVFYSPSEPITTPLILNLPRNGFRLRFDGPDQRLRLIEILDFTKTRLSYKETDITKIVETKASVNPRSEAEASAGPTFRHVYNRLMGPTFPGEYLAPRSESASENGVYILSYPGVAFTFPLRNSAWTPKADFVSLLSSNAAAPATSMAIFDGQSWQEARQDLMTRPCSNPRSLALHGRGKELRPLEVDLVRIRGNGTVDLERCLGLKFQIFLGKTTPQDLVMELGPPDAIHQKGDRRLSIHKTQNRERKTKRTFSGTYMADHEELTDTDQSSVHTNTDNSDSDARSQESDIAAVDLSAECFYNYFHHGFDVFLSYPTSHSSSLDSAQGQVSPNQLVATKMLLHANVPGSYPFNRYRRCRWIIDMDDIKPNAPLNSETPFPTISDCLQQIWDKDKAGGTRPEHPKNAMVLNRDWDESPGSSCELLGGFERSAISQGKSLSNINSTGGLGFGNTKLYGFPGLLFEVLRNDAVSCLTVY